MLSIQSDAANPEKAIHTNPERPMELNDLLIPLINKGQSFNHLLKMVTRELVSFTAFSKPHDKKTALKRIMF